MKEVLEMQRDLTARLNKYRDEYYNKNAPTVTDEVYDRLYDELVKLEKLPALTEHPLNCPGQTPIPELGMTVICRKPAAEPEGILVRLHDNPVLRSRAEGDSIMLPGGTKTLKKLFIDKKIPAQDRDRIPIIADDQGIAAVVGIGVNRERKDNPNWELLFQNV